MKKLDLGIIGLTLTFAAADLATAQTRELGGSGELLDGIAALVDTGVVLKSELRARVELVAENFAAAQAQLPPQERSELPPLPILEESVLEQLVIEEILLQRADNVGLTVGDDTLNSVLATLAAQNGTTLTGFPAWLEARGIDYPRFREDQRRDLTIRNLERREVYDRIMINPRELQQCISNSTMAEADQFEYNISHILISFDPDGPTEEVTAAEEQIRDIARQLDEGADFAQLAVAWSESQTALEGGLLGWRQGAELPTIFADDIRSMDVGDHSTPIRGGGGFHIVRLNDMRGAQREMVEQLRARHILIEPTEVLDIDATRQRMEGIRDQIMAGDDFATVAQAVSDDVRSGADGGDLGWIAYADLTAAFVPEFAAALGALDVGEISEPFQTEYGWHVAQVTDTRTYDMTEDLREDACRNQIGEGKAVEETELWRQRMRNQAYVVEKI